MNDDINKDAIVVFSKAGVVKGDRLEKGEHEGTYEGMSENKSTNVMMGPKKAAKRKHRTMKSNNVV